ncbi:GNAT family N-acetyltransferase [Microcoleus sp. CAWBG58]|uniref:GNAT family N-acetyltransferase n=1 Tax=Microcoleus sp. CAWBG58 TaxID=2841651 RepID=UPI0025D85611|nr:GNAT family N-acetyltransferase [Microcoleus sp. CAWBG58]
MVEIKRIGQHQIEQAKQVVKAVSLEIWQGVLTEDELSRYDSMSDIDNVRSHYFDNNGTFLVLVDREKVVGTGAIRKLDREICELKRMWFLKEYRGQGLGWKMAQILFDFALAASYRKIRLDLANEERQPEALKFYKKLGFYPIDRYNDSSCLVFMEKLLP